MQHWKRQKFSITNITDGINESFQLSTIPSNSKISRLRVEGLKSEDDMKENSNVIWKSFDQRLNWEPVT